MGSDAVLTCKEPSNSERSDKLPRRGGVGPGDGLYYVLKHPSSQLFRHAIGVAAAGGGFASGGISGAKRGGG